MKNVSFQNDVLPLKNILYRLALRITSNKEEAEDIVQDTLIKLWSQRQALEEVKSIEAYALTICRNLSLDHLKKQENRNFSLENDFQEKPNNASNPYNSILNRDRIDLVKKLMDDLPEKQRSCIQLRDFEGKSYNEIATILNISENQVKTNIYRARQTIKTKFSKLDNYGL